MLFPSGFYLACPQKRKKRNEKEKKRNTCERNCGYKETERSGQTCMEFQSLIALRLSLLAETDADEPRQYEMVQYPFALSAKKSKNPGSARLF